MAIDLQQQLGQQQILSPQMRQGLELLQSSSLELSQLIQQAIITNPVLEQASTDTPIETAQTEAAEHDHETLSNLADEWRDHQISQQANRPGPSQETVDYMQQSIVASKTLQQHLLEQLHLAAKPPEIQHLAEIIIWSLDDRGFLSESLVEIAARESVDPQNLRSACGVVQNFSPAGVAAADLKESLMIQLQHRGKLQSLETKIVADHLKELAQHNYPDIAKSLNTNIELVTQAAEYIATLTSNPGAAFDPSQNPHIQPDIIISHDEYGELQAHLTGAYLPQLSINNDYKDILASTADNKVRKYLKDSIRDGRSLISSLSQRQETLLKITEVLLTKQKSFFTEGPSGLKPLTMNEVAELIEVHPTTVSRAATAKYMLTPQGLFELRYFFTSGVENASGETRSNTSIRDRIKNLIQEEDTKKPLSDSAIEKLLASEDIKVARRTVAKYRDQLGILPSKLRKKF